jgi:3-deoxy-D-manno-octulosonate 8-phosphate phosphatase (KDO 8-P phosphatase)
MSATTAERAAQLGITLVHQGVPSKIDAYNEIVSDIGLNDEEVAYMGDDIVDIAVLARVGLAAAPADAVAEVRERVHWLAPSPGGAGAARELLELILRAQGRWEAILRSFTPEAETERR